MTRIVLEGCTPMDHQIEITVAEAGRDPNNGDNLLSAFQKTHGDVVVEQETQSGRLTAVFFVEARSVEEAVNDGILVFARAAASAGLEPTRVIAVAAAEAALDEAPELVSA
jgi:hypothetical protein